jgi:hypothetical protein
VMLRSRLIVPQGGERSPHAPVTPMLRRLGALDESRNRDRRSAGSGGNRPPPAADHHARPRLAITSIVRRPSNARGARGPDPLASLSVAWDVSV